MSADRNFAALQRAKDLPYLADGSVADYFRTVRPRCPHCGDEISLSEYGLLHLYDRDEGEHDIECPHCDGSFSVSVHVSYSFSTDEQEAAQ